MRVASSGGSSRQGPESGRVRAVLATTTGSIKRVLGRDEPRAPLTRRERRRRRNRRAAFAVGGGALFLATFTGGLLAAPVDLTAPPPPKSALLYDIHGKLVATVRSPEAREEVKAKDIPTVMRQAIIAAEDERFLKHGGIDPLAVIRATIRDLTGSPTQGGSTITQQYIKNTFVGSSRTAMRKIREAALAVRLERQIPKETILTRYLNSVYLGQGTYGVQAAAKYYFGIPAAKLNLAQASMLAGIAPAPSRYNPVANLRLARERQFYTLNRMVANRMITSQQASEAFRNVPRIVRKVSAQLGTIAPEFADLVETELKARFAGDEDALFRGGLAVTTSLDLDLQQAAVTALKTLLPSPKDPEAAIVAIDPRTGEIRAMATKRDNGYKRGGLNLATQAFPNSGSTVKPFTLVAALEAGRSLDEGKYAPPCTTIKYRPPYRLCNAEDGEGGYFTLKTGLWQSINTLYAPLAFDVGTRKVRDVLDKTGWKARNSTIHDNWLYPSMGLGVEASPISVVEGYSTLANHGIRHATRSVLQIRSGVTPTNTGSLVFQAPSKPKGARAVPTKIADTVVDVMKGVVNYGTGYAAREVIPVAGKTGTGENYQTAWFVGCTVPVAPTAKTAKATSIALSEPLCIGVWMGFDTPRPLINVEGLAKVYGGTLPARLFDAVFRGYATATAPAPTSPAFTIAPTAASTSRPSSAPTPSRGPSPTPKPSPHPSPSQPIPTIVPSPSASPIPIPR